jgi:hypothetical protein
MTPGVVKQRSPCRPRLALRIRVVSGLKPLCEVAQQCVLGYSQLSRQAGTFSHQALQPHTYRNNGANTSVTVANSLISTCNDGPAVSLNGSPTVSPTTAAL